MLSLYLGHKALVAGTVPSLYYGTCAESIMLLQCTGQPAMEAIPLVMEPESRLYVDPVIVLDFQSLYPSQIIAYNLCYSTCLGRPSHAIAGEAPIRLGAQVYGQEKGIMKDGLSPEK